MITSLYAAILALMFVGLSINVVRQRFKHKVSLGSNNIEELQRHMRAHGNFSEYTPLFLILLSIAEINGLIPLALHGIGALYTTGRALHISGIAFHKRGSVNTRRVIGTALTMTTLIATSAILIYQFVTQMG